MAAAKDFKQSSDDDILITDGDFFVDFSDQQHILDIVYAAPNWYKEYPACGVNIQYYLSGSGVGAELNRNLKSQLEADGYSNTNSTFTQDYEGNLNLITDAIRL
jgi:hypothetical protein